MNTAPIIYIEDSEDDVVFLRLAFKREGVSKPLIHLASRKAVNAFFNDPQNAGKFCMVIVDQNLHGISSADITLRLRTQYPSIPLLEVTGSTMSAGGDEPQIPGAEVFVKPADVSSWIPLVRKMLALID